MIHLIFTSMPLSEVPGEDRFSLENAVNRWSRSRSNRSDSSLQIRKINDRKGAERLEWRTTYNRVLHVPTAFAECGLDGQGFSRWTKYMSTVAAATDVQFRHKGISRFAAINPYNPKSCIHERQDEEGLNRLELSYHLQEGPLGLDSFLSEVEWFQGYVVFFLETAAIYHLAGQALKIGQSETDNPKVVAIAKKLHRIGRICTLEDSWSRAKEEE